MHRIGLMCSIYYPIPSISLFGPQCFKINFKKLDRSTKKLFLILVNNHNHKFLFEFNGSVVFFLSSFHARGNSLFHVIRILFNCERMKNKE